MPEPAEDMIVRNLIEALERLHEDLDRVELWTAALGSFPESGSRLSAGRPVPSASPRKSRDARRSSRTACDGSARAGRMPTEFAASKTLIR